MITNKEYTITVLIDILVDYNYKFNQGKIDGTIHHETLMKLVKQSENVN